MSLRLCERKNLQRFHLRIVFALEFAFFFFLHYSRAGVKLFAQGATRGLILNLEQFIRSVFPFFIRYISC